MNRRQNIPGRIRVRVAQLKARGVRTSKGEPMSLAAIARTLDDPPVKRSTVYVVAGGHSKSARVMAAIERELGRTYWSK